MSRILILILRAYQAFLSPLLPGGCKFYPSCSHYAVEAVELHGAWRGAWLAARRVLRCRPFASGGYDPVPSGAAFRLPVAIDAEERSLKAAPLERAR